MRKRIFSLSCCVGSSFLSGFLLALAFPNHNIEWLVWIGLVPLLVAVYGRHPIWAFLLSLLAGVTFFVGICGWIMESPGYRVLHHIVAGLFLGAPFGLFGLFFADIYRRLGGGMALFAVPFLWVSIEYLRSNFSFLALPLGLLAHSQYLNPVLIQSSSFAGAYGLSFIIAMVNSAIAAIVLSFARKARGLNPAAHTSLSKGATVLLICLAAGLFALSFLYGRWALSKPAVGKEFRIALVQGNIDHEKKWNPRYARTIMQTYADLTRRAATDRPALIVWPEASSPRAINIDQRLYSEVRQIVEETTTPLLLGSTMHQKFKAQGPKGLKLRNMAFLLSPGKPDDKQEYSKIILVPFGEYVPMEGVVPWSWIEVPELANYLPGKDLTVFECPDFRFSTTICWENLFPGLVREFVNRGAQFIVNITNESWYRDTGGPYQFLAASVFRAVENRIYVLRCANTGISCFIDPHGRIVDRVKDAEGRDTYVQGVLAQTVVPSNPKTFYTRYGDWLIWISFAWLAILLIYGLFFRHGGEAVRLRDP
jgi:apolipoprotein N-acyltransferase